MNNLRLHTTQREPKPERLEMEGQDGRVPAAAAEAARKAIEGRAGWTFKDEEWDRARATLIDFATILLWWHQQNVAAERIADGEREAA